VNRFNQILAGLISAEEAIVPLFVHNPASQKIVGVILTLESAVPTVIADVQAMVKGLPTPTPPAAQ